MRFNTYSYHVSVVMLLMSIKNLEIIQGNDASVNGAPQSFINHDPGNDFDLHVFYGKVSLGRISQISGEYL